MNDPHDEPSADAPTASKAADLDSGYSAFEGATEDFGIGPGETDPFIGADLGGVTVVRLIGQGGMGRVYEARQVKPSRTVAVKVIRPGVVSESHMRRFDLEAEILARLRHPGIAQIYTVGAYRLPTGEVPFFVMEYIPDAQTLVDYADQKQLSTHERLDLFQKVCDAVAHGHARGVVHRDLKPSNILVDAVGQPKVIDFGVAKSTDVDLALTTMRTDIGQLIGTLQYMSPEQLGGRSDDVDVRSDVYALGVVLYELLSGQPPYDIRRKAVVEAARVVKEDDPTPLSSLNRTLRRDVAVIAGKCLAKEPGGRYSSAAELGADVGRYLAGDPIHASAPGLVDGVVRLARKHKGAAVAAGVVVASLLAAVVGISLFAARAERERQAAVQSEAVAEHKRNLSDLNRFHLLRERGKSTEAFSLLDDIESRFEPENLPIEVRVTRSEVDDAIAVFPGTACAFSPDGSLLAISGVREHYPPESPLEYAYIVDPVTGERLARLDAPNALHLTGSPRFSANGHTVAIGASRESELLAPGASAALSWDTRNGAISRYFELLPPPTGYPSDVDGETAGAEKNPYIDATSGRALFFQKHGRMTLDTGAATATLVARQSWSTRLARSRSGDTLVFLRHDGVVRTIRDLDTATEDHTFPADELRPVAAEHPVAAALPLMRRVLAVSDDGMLACCESLDGALMVISVDDQLPVLQVIIQSHGDDVVTSAAFGLASEVLVTLAYDGTARGLDTTSGKMLWSSETACVGAPPPCVSPDGQYFAVVNNGAVVIHRTEDGAAYRTVPTEQAPPTIVTFSPVDASIAVGDEEGGITIHRLTDGEVTRSPEKHYAAVSAIAFSPNGSMLASCSERGVAIWHTSHAGSWQRAGKYGGRSIAFDPDGTQVVVSHPEDTPGVYIVSGGGGLMQRHGLTSHGDDSHDSWFTSSGRNVVSIGRHGQIVRWPDSQSEQVLFEPDTNPYSSDAAVDNAVTRAVIRYGQLVQLWALDEPRLIGFLDTPPSNESTFVFSPDGMRLIGQWHESNPAEDQIGAAGLSPSRMRRWSLPLAWSDGTAKVPEIWTTFSLYDARTGQELKVFQVAGEADPPVVSPDSETFAISGAEIPGQARLSRTGDLIAKWLDAGTVAYSPDSRLLVVPDRVQLAGPNFGFRMEPTEHAGLYVVRFRRPRLAGDQNGTDATRPDVADSLCFTPDGSRILFWQRDQLGVFAKSGDEKTEMVFSPIATLQAQGQIAAVVCSPDGKRVAALLGEGDTDSRASNPFGFMGFGFSRMGGGFYVSRVALWNIETSILDKQWPDSPEDIRMKVHAGVGKGTPMSPTGRYRVSTSPPTIYDLTAQQSSPLAGLETLSPEAVRSLKWSWSADEKFLAVVINKYAERRPEGLLLLYERTGGQWRGPVVRHRANYTIHLQTPHTRLHGCSFSFASSGSRVFYVEGDSQWLFPSAAAFAESPRDRRFSVLYSAISSDMTRAVSTDDREVRVWDTDNRRAIGAFPFPGPRNIPDGSIDQVRCSFNRAGSVALIWRRHDAYELGGFGFNGGSAFDWSVLWSMERPQQVTAVRVKGVILDAAMSPTEDRFALLHTQSSNDSETQLAIFDNTSGALAGEWDCPSATHVSFVPGNDQHIWTWETNRPGGKMWGKLFGKETLANHATQLEVTGALPAIDSWMALADEQAILAMESATASMNAEDRRVTRGAFLKRSAEADRSRQQQRLDAMQPALQPVVADICRQAAEELWVADFANVEEYHAALERTAAQKLAMIRDSLSRIEYARAFPMVGEAAYEMAYSEPEESTASIRTLTVEQARALIRRSEREELDLSGLAEISPSVATALSKYDGWLILNGLTVLTNEAAEAFAQSRAGSVELDGLTTLPDEAATALAKYQGELGLNGLTTLSPKAAQALAQRRGELELNGINALPLESAKALSARRNLELNGLTYISTDLAKALVSQREAGGSLTLNGLETLKDEVAGVLAQSEGGLSLDGLTELTSGAAESLSRHRGKLSLNGLKRMPVEIAQSLARHVGTLSLNGIDTLSDEEAELLAGHQAVLRLEGLTTLSAKAASILGADPDCVLPDQIPRSVPVRRGLRPSR